MRKDTNTLAQWLLSENRSGRSWQRLADEEYGGQINRATLCDFAHTGKPPKSIRLRKALGLIAPPAPLPPHMRWWRGLGRESRNEIVEQLYAERN